MRNGGDGGKDGISWGRDLIVVSVLESLNHWFSALAAPRISWRAFKKHQCLVLSPGSPTDLRWDPGLNIFQSTSGDFNMHPRLISPLSIAFQ